MMTFVLFKKDNATHGVADGLSVYLPTSEVVTPPTIPSQDDNIAFAMGKTKSLPIATYDFVKEATWLVLALSEDKNNVLGVITGLEVDFQTYHDANVFFTEVSEVDLANYSDMTPLLSSNSKLGVKSGWEENLAAVKAAKSKLVDARTEELISAGFTFNGDKFSCSQNAQSTWNTMLLLKASIAPVSVNTLDDTKAIELADTAAIEDFYGAYALFARSILDGGSAIKVGIRTAPNELAVAAIKDER